MSESSNEENSSMYNENNISINDLSINIGGAIENEYISNQKDKHIQNQKPHAQNQFPNPNIETEKISTPKDDFALNHVDSTNVSLKSEEIESGSIHNDNAVQKNSIEDETNEQSKLQESIASTQESFDEFELDANEEFEYHVDENESEWNDEDDIQIREWNLNHKRINDLPTNSAIEADAKEINLPNDDDPTGSKDFASPVHSNYDIQYDNGKTTNNFPNNQNALLDPQTQTSELETRIELPQKGVDLFKVVNIDSSATKIFQNKLPVISHEIKTVKEESSIQKPISPSIQVVEKNSSENVDTKTESIEEEDPDDAFEDSPVWKHSIRIDDFSTYDQLAFQRLCQNICKSMEDPPGYPTFIEALYSLCSLIEIVPDISVEPDSFIYDNFMHFTFFCIPFSIKNILNNKHIRYDKMSKKDIEVDNEKTQKLYLKVFKDAWELDAQRSYSEISPMKKSSSTSTFLSNEFDKKNNEPFVLIMIQKFIHNVLTYFVGRLKAEYKRNQKNIEEIWRKNPYETKIKDFQSISFSVQILDLILTSKCNFYENNGVYSKNLHLLTKDLEKFSQSNNTNDILDWKTCYGNCVYLSPNKNQKEISSYFVHNVNLIGRLGAFNQVISIMEKNKLTTPILMSSCLRVLTKAYRILNSKIGEKFYSTSVQALKSYFLSLDDKLLRTYKLEDFHNLISLVLAAKQNIQLEDLQNRDILQLSLYLTYFSSKLIDVRMRGLANLRKIVKEVLETTANSEGIATKWLNTKYLAQWFQDVDILKVLIEGDLNLSLMQQSKPILTFYAKYSAIRPSELATMWNAASGKHISLQQCMYDLILTMQPYLNPSVEKSVIELFLSSQVRHIQPHILDFMKTFLSESASKNKKNGRLDIFWALMQDTMEVNLDISQRSGEIIQSLISRPEFEHQRKKLIQSCCENIKLNLSVTQTLTLLRHIISTYPVKSKKKNSVWGVFDQLNEKYKLTQILLESLTPSNGIFSPQKPRQEKKHSKHLTLRELVEIYKHPSVEQQLSSRYPLEKKIEAKLLFLSYLIKNSSSSLSLAHCNSLWSSLYENMNDQRIRSIFIEWLKTTRSTQNADHLLSDKTAKEVFELIIKKIDLKQMDLSTFSLFFSFLISINVQEKKIHPIFGKVTTEPTIIDDSSSSDTNATMKKGNGVSLKDRISNILLGGKKRIPNIKEKLEVKKFEILTSNLCGIEHLWNIVLDAENVTVYKRAICFLNDLHYEYSPQVRHLTANSRREHVATCMKHIKLGLIFVHKGVDELANRRHILRSIEVLLDYIHIHTSLSNQDILSSASENDEDSYSISLNILDFKQTVPLIIPKDATIQDFFNQAQKVVGKSLKIYVNGEELNSDVYSLIRDIIPPNGIANVKIKDKSGLLSETLDILGNAFGLKHKPKHEGKMQSEPIEVDDSQPTVLLMSQYFHDILEVLTLDEDIGYKAWTLIQHLPTNQQMVTEMENIPKENEIDMKKILPLNYPYLLLYKLKIIDSILHNGDLEKVSYWSQNFCERGGLSYILSIVREFELKSKSAESFVHKHCFSLCLKLINTILSRCDNKNLESLEENLNSILNTTSKMLDPTSIRPRRVSHRGHIRLNSSDMTGSSMKRLPPPRKEGSLESNIENIEVIRNIISQAMLFILWCCNQNKKIATFLSNHNALKNTIWCGLIVLPDRNCRQLMHNCVIQLRKCIDSTSFDYSLISYIFQNLNKIDIYETQSQELFEALEEIISSCNAPSPEEEALESNYILYFIDMILSRPIIEVSPDDCDILLVGLLRVLRALIERYPEQKEMIGSSTSGVGIIKEFFHHLLFDFQFNLSFQERLLPKCKSNQSRYAAFQVLLALHEGSEENCTELYNLICDYIMNPTMMQNIENVPWGYAPVSIAKHEQGFVGLRNLGATCYINSLLQQLFMSTSFRNELLKLSHLDRKLENHEVLYQVQRIFAYLLGSYKQSVSTVAFCKSYKDFEGNEINPGRQQDANEFFNFLFDKMEDALRGSEYSKLLQQHFGGRLVNLIEYEVNGEMHTNSIEEPFYSMNLEVKHQNSILGSLKLINDGEMLKGDSAYHSEELKAKVDAHSRTFVKELPPILTFHLKRFEYNVQTQTSTKLNDSISFPTTLDMYPYTVESVADQEEWESKNDYQKRDNSYYNYTLVGVLVHTGGVNSGHYYSYIMDRTKPDHPWFEFNDCQVTKFSIDQLPEKCFGGIDEIIVKRENGEPSRNRIARVNNAYMLFYQRTSSLTNEYVLTQEEYGRLPFNTFPLSVLEEPHWDIVHKELVTVVQASSSKRKASIEGNIGLTIQTSIYEELLKDNQTQFYLRNTFDAYFDQFLYSISNSKNIDIPLLTYYTFQIVAHSRFNEKSLFLWGNLLSRKLHQDVEACKYFISHCSNQKFLTTYLLLCPVEDVKILFSKLIIQGIWILKNEIDSKTNVLPESNVPAAMEFENLVDLEPVQPINQPQEMIQRLITLLVSLIPDVKHYRKGAYTLISTCLEISKMGKMEKQILLDHKVVKELLGVFAIDNSRKTIVEAFGTKTFEVSLSLISTLVRSCETVITYQKGNSEPRPPTFEKDYIEGRLLDKETQSNLFNCSIFANLASQNVNVEALISILQHWCWESMAISKNFSGLIVDKLDIQSLQPLDAPLKDYIAAFIKMLEGFISIEDSIKNERKREVLDNFLNRLVDNRERMDQSAALACVKFLVYNPDEYVIDWLEGRRSDLLIICRYNGWTPPRTHSK